MKKDLDEVMDLIKGVIEIDQLASKQYESIAKLKEKGFSVELVKEIKHVESAINSLQSTINSIYYNLIGE